VTGRSWRWALIASLALNLLLLGVIGTYWWRWPRWQPMSATLSELVETLPDADRATLRPLVEKQQAETKAGFDQIKTLRLAARAAVLTEPYDAARVEAAFDALREKSIDLRADSQTTLLAILSKLPLEQRRQLTERKGMLGPP